MGEIGYEVYDVLFFCNSLSKGSAPEGTLLKEAHVKSGYNAEVIRSTFEGAVKGRIRSCVGVDSSSGGEDNLEVEHIVTSEAVTTGEERHASYAKLLARKKI